jgi:hypothetical protein
VKDSVNQVSTKPHDDKKSRGIITHDNHSISSEKESSFENSYHAATQRNIVEIDCSGIYLN